MPLTLLDLHRQGKAGSLTDAEIASNAAIALSKLAAQAANTVVANGTGSSAVPTAISLTAAATAAAAVIRDANANARFNNVVENFQSIASSAGSTPLTVASPKVTQITGVTTQTVITPDATTLVVGQSFTITNRSTGIVTVNMNGGSLLQTMASGSFLTATVTNISTAAGIWDAAYTSAGGSGSVTTVSVVSANGLAGTVSNASTTPAITLTTTLGNGVIPKSNGTGFIAAVVGTDILAPSSFVARETPGGTINGSNAAFTLVNTPLAGTEHVYFNGQLLEPGAGNDYTIAGNTITMLTTYIPVTGDKIRVSYFK